MLDLTFQQITIDRIAIPVAVQKNIGISVLRLDKIHPVISGNKWFKLRYYIDEAVKQKKTIVTFGGAWSNHIIATAAASKRKGISCIGIIRGEEAPKLSPTLQSAKILGMKLIFVSREQYAQKKLPPSLSNGDYLLVNEGGYGEAGARGASTITKYFNAENYSHVCCSVGTGTMLAGLCNVIPESTKVIGISVMKNNFALDNEVKHLLTTPGKAFTLLHNYHCGGYAKHGAELISFMNQFYQQTAIPSDFVYTAKLFYAVNDLLEKDFFSSGNELLLIHSGGLQGNASLEKGTLIF